FPRPGGNRFTSNGAAFSSLSKFSKSSFEFTKEQADRSLWTSRYVNLMALSQQSLLCYAVSISILALQISLWGQHPTF
uniref:Uncharacterized protein n=1 Tax=Junco hyemalis TaxID=40217 RepID=A0A8C5J5Z2_JUNHY